MKRNSFVGFMKCSLIISNFLLFAASIGMMVITVMGIIQTNGLPGFIVTPGDMTIAALSFNTAAVIISFIGCLGAWKEYRCLLYTYAVICGSLSAIHLVFSIVFFMYSNQITATVTTKLNQSFENRNKYEEFEKDWKIIQSNFQCCGFENFTDWHKNDSGDSTNPMRGVPACCCYKVNSTTNECTVESVYKDGCGKVVETAFKILTRGLGGFTLFLFLIWFMAGSFALSVAKSSKYKY